METKWTQKQKRLIGVPTSHTLEVEEDTEEVKEVEEDSVDLEIVEVNSEIRAKVEANLEEEASHVLRDLENRRLSRLSRTATIVAGTTIWVTVQHLGRHATGAKA